MRDAGRLMVALDPAHNHIGPANHLADSSMDICTDAHPPKLYRAVSMHSDACPHRMDKKETGNMPSNKEEQGANILEYEPA